VLLIYVASVLCLLLQDKQRFKHGEFDKS